MNSTHSSTLELADPFPSTPEASDKSGAGDSQSPASGTMTENDVSSLTVVSGEGAGCTCRLGDRTVVGRRKDCGLVLFEETVSRRHALILREPDGYYLHDLDSQNGTFVNGEQMTSPTRLNDGDEVRLDVVTLVFHSGEAPPQSDVSAQPRNDDAARRGIVHENGQIERPSDVVTSLYVQEAIERRTGVNAEIKLRAVLEIARNLGSSTNTDDFLARVLDSLFEVFPQCTRGYVLLSDPTGLDLRAAAIRQRRDETDSPATVRPLARSIARRAMIEGEALLCSDRQEYGTTGDDASIFPTPFDSVMCAPLYVPSREPLGILYLDTQDGSKPFTDDDLDVLASVAALTGHAVEHARLYETQREFDRREDELAAARRVQRHLLPQEPPHIPGYNFFDYYRPALDVGGDYFSYIEMPDGRLAIALGDVAGKGLSAALLMARLTADVRNCLISTQTPADALRKLNQVVARQELAPLRFITLALCVLDPSRHDLIVANAGHLRPLLRRAETGEVEEVGTSCSGMALGVDGEAGYTQTHVELTPGDTVLLYTDGLSEAMAGDDSLYGTERLRTALAAGEGKAADISTSVLSDVRRFVGERGFHDDVCLTCFQRAGHGDL